MDELMLRRTKAKTPVFRVGQLESNHHYEPFDAAQLLAEHYRALLPPRLTTPFVEIERKRIPHKTIRKVKCQQSLRNLNKLHSRASSISDSETLVGSPSPTGSPTSLYFDKKLTEPPEDFHVTEIHDDSNSSFENDMALKICMDLLTSELSTALSQRNHQVNEDRQSGLQVLLMIEAYETVQQHLRQKRYEADGSDTHINDVENILEHWLDVLYSVYDRSHELSVKGNEEYFPPPLFLGSRKPGLVVQNEEMWVDDGRYYL